MPWLTFFFLCLSPPAQGQTGPSCASPHDAAWTHLHFLQPESYDPTAAAKCFDLPADRAAEGPRLAKQLKDVLDARGLFVPVDDLPKDPQHGVDEGSPRVVLHPDLPQIAVVLRGDRWLYSPATLALIPALHGQTFSPAVGQLRERLPPVFSLQLWGVAPWQVLFLGLLIGIGWLAGTGVNWLLHSRLMGWLRAVNLSSDLAVFERTRRPMRWLVMGLILWWRTPDLLLSVQNAQGLFFLCKTLVSVSVVLIALRWIDVFAGVFMERAGRTDSRMDDQLIPLTSRAAKLVAVLLGLVWVLENMGVDVGSLVAGLGIGGLAVALAAKDTLANVFGSLTIFGDRPFQIGDWVVLGDGVEGTVEEVGFRSTRVRTFYNSVVTVPNALVANAQVDNMGQREFRRFKTTLSVTYDTPPDLLQAFVEGIRAVLAANPLVRQDYYEVHVRDLGASGIDIMIYSFFDVPGWHEELVGRSQVILEILRLARSLGVDFAFPSQSLYLEATPEHPLPGRISPEASALVSQIEAFGPGGSESRPGGPTLTHGYKAGVPQP